MNSNKMKIRFKKLHTDAKMPFKAHKTDAGYDLYSVENSVDNFGNYVARTGIAIEIPVGYVGLVFPRSSISKKNLMMVNSVGVIDSGYRGEITIKFHKINKENNSTDSFCYSVGDRVGQLIILPYPEIEFVESEELSDSDRGLGGYGSTGE